MREVLIWYSMDMGISFGRFRDTVVAQTAMVIMNRGAGADAGRRGEPRGSH